MPCFYFWLIHLIYNWVTANRKKSLETEIADDAEVRTTPATLILTGAAIRRFHEIYRQYKFGDSVYMRLSTYLRPEFPFAQYWMGFDDKPLSSDEYEVRYGDFRFVLYVRQVEMLWDTRVHFHHRADGGGLTFSSPRLILPREDRFEELLQNEPMPEGV